MVQVSDFFAHFMVYQVKVIVEKNNSTAKSFEILCL